jgi:hypothetical protein
MVCRRAPSWSETATWTLRTAKAASVPSILVSFGYATDALHELAPDATIDHFDELVPKAASLLGAQPVRRWHRYTPSPTVATDLPNFDRTALNLEP